MYVIMKMICLWEGGFEDTKGVIRICKSRTDNTMANRKKNRTPVYSDPKEVWFRQILL